ncbi:ABC transporter ATP-binding protein [Proteinivorax hydrogeniformans]|uniref:ABC transporter ATP-binding protein n=1 Tax=Proteinivorax hydrogeniformans TaxID=1826727 RepID=A0AAU8HSE1_9FIRM
MILSVKNIHKSYGKEKVLKGISFEMTQPQILALVGPNGSGKSTLLNVINNLLPANEGEVTVLGKINKDPNIFKEISYMQDNSVLYDYLTGYDHLQFIGDVQGISKKEILSTAKRVGIDSYINKKVGKYSLGMKQHLLLTMAILNNPKLLILDEPLNGLDPTSAIKVRNLLLEIYNSGTAILLSSHNLAEIDRVTSQILFLKDGNLIKEDISKYEKACYDLKLDNIEKGEKALKQQDIPVERLEETLRVFIEGASLDKVFHTLDEKKVKLLDIDKKIWGSEERYKKIFVGS